MTESTRPKPSPSGQRPASDTPTGAPAWLVPLFLAGLVLVFLGERVMASLDTGRALTTGVGVLLVVGATALRFYPGFRADGERRKIETTLAVFSVVGAVAVLLYFVTTDWGTETFGIDALSDDARERAISIITVVWISLVALTVVPMVFAATALYPMRHSPKPEGRRVQAAAVAGLALGCAAVYGSLLVYAAHGSEVKADFSYFRTSRPSQSTKNVAASLPEPVQVTAFYPDVSEVRTEVERYLKEISGASPKLQVSIKDRLAEPKLARELRATQDGVIILSRGEVKETLRVGSTMKNARPKLKTLDRDFQEVLLKLVRDRRTAYLTVGHGELNDKSTGEKKKGREARILKQILQKQNYVVKDLGLSQGLASAVPADATIVMVLGPTESFAPEEIATLKRFAEGGGKLLMALDSDGFGSTDVVGPGGAGEVTPPSSAVPPTASAKPPVPKLAPSASAAPASSAAPSAAPPADGGGASALAQVVGVHYIPTVLAHEKQHVRRRFNKSDRALLVTNKFSSHASVSTLSRNSSRAAVVVSGAGALERSKSSTAKIDFAIRSLSGTFADLDKNFQFDSGLEKRKVYNLAAAVSSPGKGAKPSPKPKQKSKDKKPPPNEMRAFVLADADAVSDLLLANVPTNQLLFVDAVRWLGGEESYAGQVNTEEDVRIEHTKEKDLVWFYATIFGVPALLLGLGLWISRRSRRPLEVK